MAKSRDLTIRFLGDDKGLKGVTSSLMTSFGNLRTDIANTDGFVGKLKTGVGGLGDMFSTQAKNPAVMGAAIAGAGALAFKAVGDFADLGLQVGSMKDSTGLMTDEASRWIEVAGDMGIDAGTLEGAIGKMSKVAQNTPKHFKNLGIEIGHTNTGAIDMNATFLNAIDRLNKIEDPIKKNTEAAKIFGKGWTDMSELVGAGSDTLRTKLADVADVKVLSPEDVQQARDFRDAMDGLKDAGEEMALTFGKRLLPVVVDVVENLVKYKTLLLGPDNTDMWTVTPEMESFVKLLQDAGLWTDDLQKKLIDNNLTVAEMKTIMTDAGLSTGEFTKSVHHAGEAARIGADHSDDLNTAVHGAGEAARDSVAAFEAAETATKEMDAAYETLRGHLDDREAWRNAVDAMFAYGAEVDHSEESTDALITKLSEFVAATDTIPESVKTAIFADLDQGSIELAEAKILALKRMAEAPVWFDVNVKSSSGAGPKKATAHGTSNATPGATLVGEFGPEIVNLNRGDTVTTNSAARALNGGGTGTVVINTGADPQQVIDIIKRYLRRGGTL